MNKYMSPLQSTTVENTVKHKAVTGLTKANVFTVHVRVVGPKFNGVGAVARVALTFFEGVNVATGIARVAGNTRAFEVARVGGTRTAGGRHEQFPLALKGVWKGNRGRGRGGHSHEG
jgi:hypothetical protein